MLPGYPMLTVRWRPKGNAVDLEILQVQPAGLGSSAPPEAGDRAWTASWSPSMRAAPPPGSRCRSRRQPTTVDRGPAAQVAAAGQGRACAVAQHCFSALALAACSGLPPLRHKFEVGRDPYVMLVADAPDGRGDLWAMSPEGSDIVQITFSLPAEWSPRLSPSGDVIAFLRSREQGDTARTRIWLMNLLNGSEREVRAARQLRARHWHSRGPRTGARWWSGPRGPSSASMRRRIRRAQRKCRPPSSARRGTRH